jgi:drug/metabolite transporter (DMT)-like permease
MPKIIAILLVALVLEAVGVVYLSAGLKQIGEVQQVSVSEIGRIIGRGVTNRNILLGVLFEAVFFGALLYLLSQRDVSLIWPLTSLGFVITAFAAKLVLKEEVSWVRWAGVVCIVIGAGIITWSEKMKERKAEQTPPVASAGQAGQ